MAVSPRNLIKRQVLSKISGDRGAFSGLIMYMSIIPNLTFLTH